MGARDGAAPNLGWALELVASFSPCKDGIRVPEAPFKVVLLVLEVKNVPF